MKYLVIALALGLVAAAVCVGAGDVGAAGAAGAAEPPSAEYLPPVEGADAAETKVADDGYRYKTVRRLRYRHRRDVSQEYLPPLEQPSQEYLPPEAGADTKAAEDGYRYKTVRRLRFRSRHRRDVSEIASPPSNEYLPPVDVELAPDLKTVLGDDGYRYRTVRRLKFRRHRREADPAPAEAPANEYLPPPTAEETAAAPAAPAGAPAAAPATAAADETAAVKSAELGKDGYRYKTVRRIRYRYRN